MILLIIFRWRYGVIVWMVGGLNSCWRRRMLSIVDDTELWRFRQPDGNEDERRF